LKCLVEEGSCSYRRLSEASGLPESVVREALDYLSVNLGSVDVTGLVIAAWKRGFNVVDLALEMGWRDLEALCATVFEEAGFRVYRNLRFKCCGRRFEVDVVAANEGLVLVADCKRWSRARRSKLLEAVEEQRKRAEALASVLHSVPLPLKGGRYRVCPLVISLYGVGEKLHEGVPVVSLYELRGFLGGLEAALPDLRCYPGVKNSLV